MLDHDSDLHPSQTLSAADAQRANHPAPATRATLPAHATRAPSAATSPAPPPPPPSSRRADRDRSKFAAALRSADAWLVAEELSRCRQLAAAPVAPGGAPPICVAAAVDRAAAASVAKSLLRCGARADAVDPATGMSALHIAACAGHACTVAALLAAGADPNRASRAPEGVSGAESAHGSTALACAALRCRSDVVEELARGGADVCAPAGANAWPPIAWCVSSRYIAAVTGTQMASREAKRATIEALVRCGVDPNKPCTARGDTPLLMAAENADADAVETLVSLGAVAGATPGLVHACISGSHEIAAALCRAGADARSPMGANALLCSCTRVDVRTMRELLGHGADPNAAMASDELRLTPLHMVVKNAGAAAEHAVASAIAELIKAGADPCAEDARGLTALDLAITLGRDTAADAIRREAGDRILKRPAKAPAPQPAPEQPPSQQQREQQQQTAGDAASQAPALPEKSQENMDKRKNTSETQANKGKPNAEYAARLKALLEAVSKGDAARVDRELSACPELARLSCESGADSPLVAAARAQTPASPSIARAIVKAGASVDCERGLSALHVAACGGNAPVVAELLTLGADPNRVAPEHEDGDTECSSHGETPLSCAASAGNVAVIRLLLDAGADPNWLDNSDYTPLQRAARHGHAEAVRVLISGGALPDLPSGDGETALVLAAIHGHEAAFDALVQGGANVNSPASYSEDPDDVFVPIVCAAEFGKTKIVEACIKAGADLNAGSGQHTALTAALLLGESSSIAERLLRAGADANATHLLTEWTPLHIAADRGSVALVELLLRHGADPLRKDAAGKTPIDVAAANGYRELTELLRRATAGERKPDSPHSAQQGQQQQSQQPARALSKRERARMEKFFDTVIKGDLWLVQEELSKCRSLATTVVEKPGSGPLSALYLAALSAGRNRVAIVTLLLKSGADPNVRDEGDGLTALHAVACAAADDTDREVVEALLAGGADPNAACISHSDESWGGGVGRHGDTPLSCAASKGHSGIVEALVRGGADPNRRDASGQTPLSRAAQGGKLDAVAALLRTGADADECDGNGNTALWQAATNMHASVVDALLRAGADPNRGADTPLHAAARNGSTAVARLLLDAWADVDAQEHLFGYTPLHCAIVHNSKGVVGMLLQAGSNLGIAAKDKRTAMHVAVDRGDKEVIQMMSTYLAQLTGALFFTAVMDGNLESVRMYLERDPAIVECTYRRSEPIERIVAYSAHRSSSSSSSSPHSSKSKKGSQGGVGSNAPSDAEGDTPLLCAITAGQQSIVEALLAAGASANAHNAKTGDTPLHRAALLGSQAIVEALLRHGADANVFFKDVTPLIRAALMGYDGIVAALLKGGAEIDLAMSNGCTALHVAAGDGNIVVVERLLLAGADPSRKDNSGQTPVDHARSHGHARIVDLFAPDSADGPDTARSGGCAGGNERAQGGARGPYRCTGTGHACANAAELKCDKCAGLFGWRVLYCPSCWEAAHAGAWASAHERVRIGADEHIDVDRPAGGASSGTSSLGPSALTGPEMPEISTQLSLVEHASQELDALEARVLARVAEARRALAARRGSLLAMARAQRTLTDAAVADARLSMSLARMNLENSVAWGLARKADALRASLEALARGTTQSELERVQDVAFAGVEASDSIELDVYVPLALYYIDTMAEIEQIHPRLIPFEQFSVAEDRWKRLSEDQRKH
eukprot:m51a1_g5928 hypothetical protein (1698) ;mRNA; f:76007-81482